MLHEVENHEAGVVWWCTPIHATGQGAPAMDRPGFPAISRLHAARRSLVITLAALVPVSLRPRITHAQSASLAPTPAETEGPFYPVAMPADADADLTRVKGRGSPARGAVLNLTGTVRDVAGKPLAGVAVEIWQTDHQGWYLHPRSVGEGVRDNNFQGFGRVVTDASGQYAFRTIKPVRYASRPPHIHFRVTAPGRAPLTTQMYFAGENKEGGFASLGSGFWAKDRERLTITPRASTQEKGALEGSFEIVLG